MSSALMTSLFAILVLALVVLTTGLVVLWRKVSGLTRSEPIAPAAPPIRLAPIPAKARYEMVTRIDELAGRHRALEARLARIEASATDAALVMMATHRVDRGTSASSGGPTLISVPNLASPPSPATEAAAELDRRFGGVWAMADAGMALETIARQTDQPIGQVELILGLRRGRIAPEVGDDA